MKGFTSVMRVGSTTSRPEDLGFTPLGANRLEVDTTWSSCDPEALSGPTRMHAERCQSAPAISQHAFEKRRPMILPADASMRRQEGQSGWH